MLSPWAPEVAHSAHQCPLPFRPLLCRASSCAPRPPRCHITSALCSMAHPIAAPSEAQPGLHPALTSLFPPASHFPLSRTFSGHSAASRASSICRFVASLSTFYRSPTFRFCSRCIRTASRLQSSLVTILKEIPVKSQSH